MIFGINTTRDISILISFVPCTKIKRKFIVQIISVIRKNGTAEDIHFPYVKYSGTSGHLVIGQIALLARF